jgi:hypothetical protein
LDYSLDANQVTQCFVLVLYRFSMSKSARRSSPCSRHSLIRLAPLFVALFCGANIADAEVSRDAVAMVVLSVDCDPVFLVNKETPTREAAVALKPPPREFHGSGSLDQQPTWDQVGSIRDTNSQITVRLDPVPVNVIRLTGESSKEVPTP